jgi:hypothetical protein
VTPDCEKIRTKYSKTIVSIPTNVLPTNVLRVKIKMRVERAQISLRLVKFGVGIY